MLKTEMTDWRIVSGFLAVCLAAGFCRAQGADRSIGALLEAQGSLEAARCVNLTLKVPFDQDDEKASNLVERIPAACMALKAGSRGERVRMALADSFRRDIAFIISPAPLPTNLALSPVYPPGFKLPDGTAPQSYGTAAVIDDNPACWQTPGLWGKPPQPPVFAGWRITRNRAEIKRDCQALARTDITVDDAEVSGEVRLDGGDAIYLVVRSDIIVKFHAGKPPASGGNLNVKFGYDNLRTSSVYSKVPELLPGTWHAFKVEVSGDTLIVTFDGAKALDAPITRDPKIPSSRIVRSGRLGMGSLNGEGAFRNLTVRALTEAGRRRLPRLAAGVSYVPDGQPLRILESPEGEFIALTHNKTEPYKPSRHPVSNGILQLSGAPYAQFAHKKAVADNFRISGRIRFLEQGSAWFRVNCGLLFGVRVQESSAPFVVKHGTGNFNSVDEEFPGLSPELNRWYEWELEYREPAGFFKFNGERVMVSVTPPNSRDKLGPNQPGISAYATKTEVGDLVFSRLAPGGVPDPSDMSRTADWFRKGFEAVERVMRSLQSDPSESAAHAWRILDGSAPPLCASTGDFREIAGALREKGDWPVYLSLLEAVYTGLPPGSEASLAAKKEWEEAKTAYDQSLKATSVGEMGLDGILRTGDRAGPMFHAGDGAHVCLFLPLTGELLKFNPGTRKVTGKINPAVRPRQAEGRGDYFLCTEAEANEHAFGGESPDEKNGDGADTAQFTNRVIYKLSLKDGSLIASAGPTNGMILDFAPHPRKRISYFTVNENAPDEFNFAKCRVYVLDEETMQARLTGAMGMLVAVDPLGRYLYTGFSCPVLPQKPPDTSFLRAMPQGVYLDHLIQYRLTGDGPVFAGQRAMPGLVGVALIPDPSGRQVCYAALRGMFDQSTMKFRQFAIGSYKASDPSVYSGCYMANDMPCWMEFDPVRPAAYVCTSSQVRRYNTRTFEFEGAVPLPSLPAQSTIRQATVSADGSQLLVLLHGTTGGMCVRDLGPAAPSAPGGRVEMSEAAALAAVNAAAGMLSSRQSEAVAELNRLADRFLFSPPGEAAARALIGNGGWYVAAQPGLFELPVVELSDTGDDTSVTTITMPAGRRRWTGDADPVHGGKPEFADAIAELRSFDFMAAESPWSWLLLCARAEDRFPGSPLLKYLAAERLLAMGLEDSASKLAGKVISITGGNGPFAFKSYLFLARIYRAHNDYRREYSALQAAVLLDPADPVANARFGTACSKAGLTKLGRHHRLLAWHVLPSFRRTAMELRMEGTLPAPAPADMDAAALFKLASPAIVLITRGGGNGTGFIIGRNGYLLTNQHVIEGAGDIKVTFTDPAEGTERTVDASIVAADTFRDIALLRIEPGDVKLPVLTVGDSSIARTGEEVVAIGNPGMGRKILTQTATEGIISSVGRRINEQTYFQISAAVNPGNSGGPLLNRRGEVIGMITIKSFLENVGFAVPSNELLDFLDSAVGE